MQTMELGVGVVGVLTISAVTASSTDAIWIRAIFLSFLQKNTPQSFSNFIWICFATYSYEMHSSKNAIFRQILKMKD